ncbi:MAG: rhomboid family intramembrane serine protease [Candidatus Aenigmarchaeota archaeon]|nr:rhomboid family intramembrane serine protease [Candidatus Aenigmarchaeota archaeon]
MRNHPLTWLMIVLNLAVFLLVFSMPEALRDTTFDAYSFSRGTALEAWRWLTAMFLQVSASHLFFNMLGLYFFGKHLEEETSKGWWLAIYFISGILGSFAFLLTSPEPVVGASGAVFGVMGAVMLLNPTRMIHLYVFPLPIGIVAVIFIVVETMVAVYKTAFQQLGNVATVAHIAGIATGAIFAFFYKPKRSLQGVFVLALSLALLAVLGPAFALIAEIGSIALQVIDAVVGFFLYNIAGLLGFLWA